MYSFNKWCLSGKESFCSAGDAGSIPGSGRCPGGENGNPLQYSCLENPIDRSHGYSKVRHDLVTKQHSTVVSLAGYFSIVPQPAKTSGVCICGAVKTCFHRDSNNHSNKHLWSDSMDMNQSKLQEILKDRGAWCATVHRVGEKRFSGKQHDYLWAYKLFLILVILGWLLLLK